jgi:hypothetical protein
MCDGRILRRITRAVLVEPDRIGRQSGNDAFARTAINSKYEGSRRLNLLKFDCENLV